MATVEHDLTGFEAPGEPGPEPQSEMSIMGRLRAQRAEIASRSTTTFPIPGWKDPELVPEFRLLTPDEIKAISVRVRRQFSEPYDQLVYAALDQAITACVRICYREGDSLELKELELDRHGPMRFDQRLADLLELDTDTARGTLLGLFPSKDGGVNLTAAFGYCQRLGEWMGDTSVRLDEGVTLGEASGAG
jgi:hypothetical protein